MFFSLIVYPISLFLSVFCEKKGYLYGYEYMDNDVFYDIKFNIYNDIIFPIYAAKNRTAAPASVDCALLLWSFVVSFLTVGLMLR